MADYMSIRSASMYLNYSKTALYRLIKNDKSFPLIKIGGKMMCDRHDLDKWVIEQKRKATAKKYPRRD